MPCVEGVRRKKNGQKCIKYATYVYFIYGKIQILLFNCKQFWTDGMTGLRSISIQMIIFHSFPLLKGNIKTRFSHILIFSLTYYTKFLKLLKATVQHAFLDHLFLDPTDSSSSILCPIVYYSILF